MKGSFWLVLIVLGLSACGGATTAITTATTAATTTTTTTAIEAGRTDLSGLGFEVHKEPG
ncbi:MAG: hypothetical protein OEY62_04130 [Acidimicrobiia bacterium]|nr:hypothetical protein [Acidimicrobiia bacterium]